MSTLNWLYFNSLVSPGTALLTSPAAMILLIPTPEGGSCSSRACHGDQGRGIPSALPMDADAEAGKWPPQSHPHISCWRNQRAAPVSYGYLGAKKVTAQSHQCTLLVYGKSTVAISCIHDIFKALKSRMVFVSVPLLGFKNKPNYVHLPELLLSLLSKRYNFLFWNFLVFHFHSEILYELLKVSLENIQLSNSMKLKQFESILCIAVLSNNFHVSVLLIWVWTISPLLE